MRCKLPGPQLPAQTASSPVRCASVPAANAATSSDMHPCDLSLAPDGIGQTVKAIANDAVDTFHANRRENLSELICDSSHNPASGFIGTTVLVCEPVCCATWKARLFAATAATRLILLQSARAPCRPRHASRGRAGHTFGDVRSATVFQLRTSVVLLGVPGVSGETLKPITLLSDRARRRLVRIGCSIRKPAFQMEAR